jgi:hypothetical protein
MYKIKVVKFLNFERPKLNFSAPISLIKLDLRFMIQICVHLGFINNKFKKKLKIFCKFYYIFT